MSDVFIFGMGCFVSLFVVCAVSLLFWGAANEPRGELVSSAIPEPSARRNSAGPAASAQGLASAPGLELESPA